MCAEQLVVLIAQVVAATYVIPVAVHVHRVVVAVVIPLVPEVVKVTVMGSVLPVTDVVLAVDATEAVQLAAILLAIVVQCSLLSLFALAVLAQERLDE